MKEIETFEQKYKKAHKAYCYWCEAYLEDDWKFCPYCGKMIGSFVHIAGRNESMENYQLNLVANNLI